ncbi:DNA helicase RecQ [Calycomorphotria hydatis]|uniref:DNA helicase RecQ n=1 Tax=Calycomorphotria hydatis TaxID=2528027 RepID=A0A517T3P9_9PLAN|nr:DNA helicase RecQ [Calycomorphotria hydatis]QDT63002.1 ATP-dependent DNA helicase RecQ [Calycomorphotria hydatis]
MDADSITAENPAIAVLQRYWGYESFRPLQAEAIEHVLEGRDSVVVLPTGGGKSLCYQVPAVCMDRPAVVISPLVSLMKDQVDTLQACGIAAGAWNSSQSPEVQQQVRSALRSGELKLLYVSPERLLIGSTLEVLVEVNPAFFAIDEAHCVSQWGHDFRPEYRRLQVLKEAFPQASVHAFTATASPKVRVDIAEQLALTDPEMIVGNFDRPNLTYRVKQRDSKGKGFAQIQEVIDRYPNESGIIYRISRKNVEETAEKLRAEGYSARPYHAGLSDRERHQHQEEFLQSQTNIIVATVAFGMGIDKPDVRYVVHGEMPKSLEHYQQEAGRAGRDGLPAECLLLYSAGDAGLWRRLQSNNGSADAGADAAISAMADYCEGIVCRHRGLVEHFGQEFESTNCGACDICLGEIELADEPQVLGQKILSCVVRLEQRYGADYTANVLIGSREQRILQAGHDDLSTYGLLESEKKKTVRGWIEQLKSQGYLRAVGEYSVLQVTPDGLRLLKGEATPTLKRPPARKRRDRDEDRPQRLDADWDDVDSELFLALRELRTEQARERGVPPYIIFGDAALRDMARKKPTTMEEFLEVKGVGQKKANDYGEMFLAVIRSR